MDCQIAAGKGSGINKYPAKVRCENDVVKRRDITAIGQTAAAAGQRYCSIGE